MSDVTLSSFIVSLDFVHPFVDLTMLQEYTKSNFKKEFIFINALDFVDSSGGRTSRNDSKREAKPKVDIAKSISKGIKAKIDSELSKLLESKKRHLAQAEKQKTKESRKSQKTLVYNTPLYGGQTEVVFCIANFPYTGKQMQRLKDYGVDLGAVIAVKSNKSENEYSVDQAARKNGDKSARNTAKRNLIEGADMDSSNNPDVFPPLRWNQIKVKADPTTVFATVEAGDTIEDVWQKMEKEIGRIIKCGLDFHETIKSRVFQNIPQTNNSIESTKDKIASSVVGALINNEIKEKEIVAEPTMKEKMDDLFAKAFEELQRDVVTKKPDNKEQKQVEIESIPFPAANVALYKLLKWKPSVENAFISRAVLDFYTNDKNFYAVAGHQFETMIVHANKKLALGMPTGFFNWQKWNYCKEHKDVRDVLCKALRTNNIIDVSLEESPGILWLLLMEPVSKGVGSTLKSYYMPQMIDGVDEWYKYIFEVEDKEEPKSRVKETTATVIRNGKTESLLIPFKSRLNGEGDVYRVPIGFSDVVGLNTPYLFADGFKAEVIRDVNLGKASFAVKGLFQSGLSFKSDGVTTKVEHNFTHFYIKKGDLLITNNGSYSVHYSKDKLIIRKSGDENIIITKDATIIFVGKDGIKTIIDKYATIGRLIDNKWKWTNRKGQEYVKKEDGTYEKENPIRPILDVQTKIKRYVRNDYISIDEHEDGTLVVKIFDDLIVKFSKNSVNYKLPSLPDINLREGEFHFQIDGIAFEISEALYIEAKIFNVTASFDNVSLSSENTIASFDTKAIQIRSSDEVLYATKSCIERFGHIQEPNAKVNKKLEVVSSLWGNVIPIKDKHTEAHLTELHKLFCPRFFAIRKDLSATEFFHESQLPFEERTMKTSNATILDQTIDIVSFHKDGEQPISFIKEEVPDKRERISILKTLQIPRKPKPKLGRQRKNEVVVPVEDIFNESEEKRSNFYFLRNQFGNACESITKENEEEFILEIHPPEIPPEPIPPLPVFTPSPEILIMQAEKYSKNPKKGEIISFWDSPEGEFAKPEKPNKVLVKPVSSRMEMHDLSTPQITSKDAPPEIDDEDIQKTRRSIARAILTPSSLSTPHTAQRMYRTEVIKPALQFPDKKYSANFGNLHVGDVAIQIVKVQNTSPTKVNFSFTTPSHPGISVITPPGVIASGLTFSVKLRFIARKPENVRASFLIQTNQGNIPVSCNAKVVV